MADFELTVVTVTFNAKAAFLKTLESVGAQTARGRFEYLVVDGASTDGTVGALEDSAGKGLVDRWQSESDQGIYDAMNKAVGLASGEYILFLNAGDVFPAPDTVERFLGAAETRPDFYWGDSEVDRGGKVLADPAHRMRRFLYRQMTVCHQSLAVRTERLKSHPFQRDLRVAADYEVLCWLVAGGFQGVYQPVVVSRVEDEGFSSKNFFLGLDEKRRVSRTYFPRDRWRSGPYFTLWGFYMRVKTWYKERP